MMVCEISCGRSGGQSCSASCRSSEAASACVYLVIAARLRRLFQRRVTRQLLFLIWCVFLPQAQYILIHQALLEHSQFGETELSLQELHSTLNTLKQRSSDNDSTLMEDEFDV